MAKIIIDADNSAMGRVASFAAKSALRGDEVSILNSEKAIISGRKVDTIEDYKARRTLNHQKPEKGPFFSKSTDGVSSIATPVKCLEISDILYLTNPIAGS